MWSLAAALRSQVSGRDVFLARTWLWPFVREAPQTSFSQVSNELVTALPLRFCLVSGRCGAQLSLHTLCVGLLRERCAFSRQVIIAAELLKNADELVKQKIHPTSVISGYRLACK